MRFDSPFIVNADRSVDEVNSTLIGWATIHDETAEAPNDIVIESDRWEPLVGHSNQQSYAGAVLHPSEQLSGSLADYVLDSPGTYVITEVLPNDMDHDSALIGWVILRLKD